MTKNHAKREAFKKAKKLEALGYKVRVVFRSGVYTQPGKGLASFKGYEVQIL